MSSITFSMAVVSPCVFAGGVGGHSLARRPATQAGVSGKVGDGFLFNINNIIMPMDKNGVMANVDIGGVSEGRFQGAGFLFSGGFIMSGKNPNGTVWANGQASASRVQDYTGGRAIRQSTDDPQVYVVDGDNVPFGTDWQDWADAVAMGADFYDGDGDGIYSPIDLNGNGKWDPNEDRPDLLGDLTAWCIYTDNIPSAQRRFSEVPPRGIDIEQSVFGFRSAGLLGNMLFIRYRIINSGKFEQQFDSVYFGVWADPDLGGSSGYIDDLVGCDTLLNAGFTWNDGPDPVYGANPPCFLIDFFQGPIVFLPGVTFVDGNGNGVFDPGETPLDTAFNVRGQVLGVDTIPGAKSLGLASFVNYIQSNPDRGDPNNSFEARNYTTGKLRLGTPLDPCNDTFGQVFGIPCTDVNPTFWYSGDPTVDPGYGWIYTTPDDMRQMQNVGPFTLKVGEPVDVVIAYIVGRASDARSSVAAAKNISTFAQFIYDRNFETAPPPPVARPTIRTTDNSIEFIWETHEQMNYRAVSSAYDVTFGGFEVTMYNSRSTSAVEGGRENARIIARYDVADSINNILIERSNGERVILYEKGIQLEPQTHSVQGRGRIRLQITNDPFTGGPLIKGRPYFFSIVGYVLNRPALVRLSGSPPTDYVFTSASFITFTANVPTILNDGIVPGIDFNNPYRFDQSAAQISGISQGRVYFDDVQRNLITGHEYRMSFFKDLVDPKYSVFWKLEDATLNVVKADSQKTFIDSLDYAVPLIDGMRVRVVNVVPAIPAPTYSATPWYTINPGIFYTGRDLPGPSSTFSFATRQSLLTQVEGMRKVEIRFGPSQRAYRYVNGLPPFGITRYEYAAAQPSADSLNPNFRRGYVDVPFQTWIKDERRGEERQVNCAFFEDRRFAPPDGIWNPGTSVEGQTNSSREFIVIYDTDYSPDTSIVYTGGVYNGFTRWANGWDGWIVPTQWAGAIQISQQDSIRAADKWIAAMYVAPLQRNVDDVTSDTLFYRPSEVLTIHITYPFASNDAFTYQSSSPQSPLTSEARKSLFDRVTVFPNPLFAYNPGTSYTSNRGLDEPYVTFSNLPENVSVRIYSLSGVLLRTLTDADKSLGTSSPFLQWDLENESGLRVASGMYLAIVSSPGIGEKVLKFAIIMPQKQIQKF